MHQLYLNKVGEKMSWENGKIGQSKVHFASDLPYLWLDKKYRSLVECILRSKIRTVYLYQYFSMILLLESQNIYVYISNKI